MSGVGAVTSSRSARGGPDVQRGRQPIGGMDGRTAGNRGEPDPAPGSWVDLHEAVGPKPGGDHHGPLGAVEDERALRSRAPRAREHVVLVEIAFVPGQVLEVLVEAIERQPAVGDDAVEVGHEHRLVHHGELVQLHRPCQVPGFEQVAIEGRMPGGVLDQVVETLLLERLEFGPAPSLPGRQLPIQRLRQGQVLESPRAVATGSVRARRHRVQRSEAIGVSSPRA
jgi:hypothetical protein